MYLCLPKPNHFCNASKSKKSSFIGLTSLSVGTSCLNCTMFVTAANSCKRHAKYLSRKSKRAFIGPTLRSGSSCS